MFLASGSATLSDEAGYRVATLVCSENLPAFFKCVGFILGVCFSLSVELQGLLFYLGMIAVMLPLHALLLNEKINVEKACVSSSAFVPGVVNFFRLINAVILLLIFWMRRDQDGALIAFSGLLAGIVLSEGDAWLGSYFGFSNDADRQWLLLLLGGRMGQFMMRMALRLSHWEVVCENWVEALAESYPNAQAVECELPSVFSTLRARFLSCSPRQPRCDEVVCELDLDFVLSQESLVGVDVTCQAAPGLAQIGSLPS